MKNGNRGQFRCFGNISADDTATVVVSIVYYILYIYMCVYITSGVDLLLSWGGHNSHLETTHRWHINPASSVCAGARSWVEI